MTYANPHGAATSAFPVAFHRLARAVRYHKTRDASFHLEEGGAPLGARAGAQAVLTTLAGLATRARAHAYAV